MGFDITKMSPNKASKDTKISKVKTLKDKYQFKLISKDEIESEKIRGYDYAI